MRGILIMTAMSLLGAAGWYPGEPLGIYGSLVISMVASGVGFYAGRRFVREFLP